MNSDGEQSSHVNFDYLPLDNHIKLPYTFKAEATVVAFVKTCISWESNTTCVSQKQNSFH